MTVLRQGDFGSAVSDLQVILNKHGADLRVDNDFGPATAVSILQFQRSAGLEADAIVGPRTWFSLKREDHRLEPYYDYLQRYDVPYLDQRDNKEHPTGTCNITCVAMAAAYKGEPIVIQGEQLEDVLYRELLTDEAVAYQRRVAAWSIDQCVPARQVHDMLEWLLRRHGWPLAHFATSWERSNLQELLYRKVSPLIVSGSFTKAGHIVFAIGCTKYGDVLCHDPWGDWTRRYKGALGQDGCNIIYPADTFWPLVTRGGGNIWAHVLDPQ